MSGKLTSLTLVVGKKSSGKTSYLECLIRRAIVAGYKVGGFLSRGEIQKNIKSMYFLEDIQSGERRLLASDVPHASRGILYDRYHFDQQIFQLGNRLLMENLDADFLILDEFGPLERAGQGFRPAFDFLLQNYHHHLVISLRPTLLSYVQNEIRSIRW